jgi:D-alanyl-D-alanine carboxypeptidase/D-alanyl-D-alanine-endopeptidase (penicillin-binding protein 4)
VSADLQLRLVDRPCKQWEDGWQVPVTTRAADGSIRIGLRGEFPRNCAVTTRLNVLDRNEFIERLFRGLWTYLGGSFSGQVVEGRAPDDARLLAEHSSRPLAEVLRDINKTSDNPLARLLFLSLGTGGAVAGSNTSADSARAVRSWLQQQGIGDAGLVLDNGSGLSRSERIRPAMLAALLAAEYRSNWAPEFVSSLPIVALDGSMRRRLADSPAAGRARLKTGSLRNVAAIAGYVPDGSGQMQVVVAMINFDFPKDVSGQPILDALVDWVAHSGGK